MLTSWKHAESHEKNFKFIITYSNIGLLYSTLPWGTLYVHKKKVEEKISSAMAVIEPQLLRQIITRHSNRMSCVESAMFFEILIHFKISIFWHNTYVASKSVAVESM